MEREREREREKKTLVSMIPCHHVFFTLRPIETHSALNRCSETVQREKIMLVEAIATEFPCFGPFATRQDFNTAQSVKNTITNAIKLADQCWKEAVQCLESS